LHSLLIDEWTHESVGFQGVADSDGAVGGDEAFAERAFDRLVDEDSPGAGAALSGGADGAEKDGTGGKVEIGTGGDDCRIITAEFEESASEALMDDLGDLDTHRAGAGGGDEREMRVGGHWFAYALEVTDDQAKDSGVGSGVLADLFGDAGDSDRSEGSFFRWFPNDGIAANGGQGAIPGPDGDGEVEGSDDADGSERVPLFHEAVSGAFGLDGEAVELAGETDGEVADVDHFLHFPFPFGEDFAGLEADEFAEIGFSAAESVAELADRFTADWRGGGAPFQESFLGVGDGPFVVLPCGLIDGGDRFAIDRGGAFDDFATAPPLAGEDAGVMLVETKISQPVMHGSQWADCLFIAD